MGGRSMSARFGAALVLATCLFFYAAFWSGHQYSVDGVVMFQSAKPLLFRHSLRMEPPILMGMEHRVSRWGIGMTLAYVLPLAVWSQTAFRDDPQIREIPYEPRGLNPGLLDNAPYRYCSLVNPLISACSAVALFFIGLRLGFSTKRSIGGALIFGLASPAAVYAKLDFAQPLVTLHTVLAVLFLMEARQRRVGFFFCGICLGLAALTRLDTALTPGVVIGVASYFVDSAPAGARGLFERRRLGNLMMLVVPWILFLALNQFINHAKFGSVYKTGYAHFAFTSDPLRVGKALVGHLISPGRGILLYFPLSGIALFLGIRRMLSRDRLMDAVAATCVLGSLLFYSAWWAWGAGMSWGPRFLVPSLPFLTLLAMAAYDHPPDGSARAFKLLFFAQLVLGCVVTLQGLLFNFVDFYRLHPQGGLTQFDFHRNPAFSPLFAGWKDLGRPGAYDIFWCQSGLCGGKE